MAVEKIGEKYRCNVCGNEVAATKAGAGELVFLQITDGEIRSIKKEVAIYERI